MELDTCVEGTVLREVVVPFEHGLHLRPAAVLSETASTFQGEVLVRTKDQEVSGKSLLGLLTLGATCGEHLTIEARGPDASEAIQAIAALFDGS
jgi:phosphotransferase system HPr (HPr) family protein